MFDENSLLARAYYYEFLAFVFFYDENALGYDRWQAQRQHLAQSAISPKNEADFELLSSFGAEEFLDEQNSVLFDLSYANVPLNASFYDDGRDDGAARLRVIDILKQSDYRRDVLSCFDSEDFVGFIFLFSSQLLLDGARGDLKMLEYQAELFKKVINPFIDELIELLDDHSCSKFFKAIASIMQSFIYLERSVLGVNAPAKKPKSIAREAMSKKPYQSKMPTPKSKLFWDEFTSL